MYSSNFGKIFQKPCKNLVKCINFLFPSKLIIKLVRVVIILYCRDTNDEIYLRIAMNRLQRMQKNFKKPTQQYIDISKHQSETIGKEGRMQKGIENEMNKEEHKSTIIKSQSSLTDFTNKQKRDEYTKILKEKRSATHKKELSTLPESMIRIFICLG